MTKEACRQWRPLLGAYAMDRLPAPQRAALEKHLQTCMDCNAALSQVMPVARMLPHVDPRRVMREERVPPQVASELFSRIAAEKRHQRRQRWTTSGVVGVAAAVLTAMLMVPLFNGDSSNGQTVSFVAAPASVSAKSSIVSKSWGTEIHLDVAGLKGRQTVWFEQPDGTRASAGSFEAGNGEKVDLVLSTAFKASNAVALCVSPPNEPAVLRAPLNA